MAAEKNRIVDAVIFDLDGTVTDTEKYYQMAWPQAAAHFGYEMLPEMALELRSLGQPFAKEKLREWFGEEFDCAAVRAYRMRLVDEMIEQNGIPLKPGAISLFTALRERGIASALATANNYQRAKNKLEKAGIFEYFDRVICADMVAQGKPAPDIYRLACEELGLLPERTFAVEDSPNGIRSAYAAGCKAVMVPDLTEPDEELKKMLYARVDSLENIKELLDL